MTREQTIHSETPWTPIPGVLTRALALVLIAVMAQAGAVTAQEDPPAEEPSEAAFEEPSGGGTWAEVKEAYEKARRKAKAMGETVPDKIPDWVKEDLENVGDWEYRVVEASRGELQATLNELGAERWECFSVESHGKKSQLVFKRRKRSRLRELQDLSPDDLLTVIKLMRDRRLDKE